MATYMSQQRRSLVWLFVLGLFSALVLVGCGGGSDSPSDTRLESETAAAPSATAPATPTATTAETSEYTPTTATEPTATATPSPVPPTATPTEQPPTPTPVPEGPSPELEGLQTALDAVLADIDGTVAVSLASSDGDYLYGMNEHETMEAASIYKLAVMVEIFRQREAGMLSFDDAVVLVDGYYVEGPDSFGWGDVGSAVTIDRLLFAMIAQSSNIASYALLDLAGTANVNTTMLELGVPGVEIRWSPGYVRPPAYNPETPETPWLDEEEPDDSEEYVEESEDENVEEPDEESEPEEFVDEPEYDEELNEPDEEGALAPTASIEPVAHWLSVSGGPDINATLRADAAFNVVTAADVARLLVLLLNGQVVSEQASSEMLDLLASQQIFGGLAMSLPDGTVAHKTGYLPDGVVNDAGVIFTPGGPYIAVVLTEYVREDIAYDIASQVAVLLYEFGS